MPPNKHPLMLKSLQSLAALELETCGDLEVKYPITNPLSHAAALLPGIWGMVSGAGSLARIKISAVAHTGEASGSGYAS